VRFRGVMLLRMIVVSGITFRRSGRQLAPDPWPEALQLEDRVHVGRVAEVPHKDEIAPIGKGCIFVPVGAGFDLAAAAWGCCGWTRWCRCRSKERGQAQLVGRDAVPGLEHSPFERRAHQRQVGSVDGGGGGWPDGRRRRGAFVGAMTTTTTSAAATTTTAASFFLVGRCVFLQPGNPAPLGSVKLRRLAALSGFYY
jgi:hypothetical protein